MVPVIAVLALLLALLACSVALPTARRARRSDPEEEELAGIPEDLLGLRQEVAALKAEARYGFRHLSVVRYDAFADMGGHLSWSVALLDDAGDGVLLTSIHGRSDARSYAKSVAAWTSEQQLSAEEQEALDHARG